MSVQLRRAADYYHAAAVREDGLAASCAEAAVSLPARISHGPCPAYPEGWTSYPRRNVAASARAARCRAAQWRTIAATLEALLAGRPA